MSLLLGFFNKIRRAKGIAHSLNDLEIFTSNHNCKNFHLYSLLFLVKIYPPLHSPPKLLYRNMSVQISSVTKVNHVSTVLSSLNEIFKLKEAKATSLVVENALKTFTFYYSHLSKVEKDDFFKILATDYGVNHDGVVKLTKELAGIEDRGLVLKAEEKLREALKPQFSWLFTHLGRLDNGVKFLVDMRSDVLALLSTTDVKSPHQLPLQQLSNVLKSLLGLWFSVGFLHLERVTWSSPCSLLQKISEYEAVHPVRSWTDIKQRVGPYRRCFVYTHHTMPEEPLVVLHVALTPEISSSMKSIINRISRGDEKTYQNETEEKNSIKAFIFYSISSTQKGLQGIDLGNYLIKRAAKELHLEHSQVMQFSSLSPIPAFRQWLLDKIKLAEKGESVFPSAEWDEVIKLTNAEDETDAWAKLRSMVSDNSWSHDENLASALKAPMMASCSRYLYLEKRRGYAFDSVANFHLRNGAVMWRINWLADTSPRGLSQSCGLMVNYRYYLDAADQNSIKYIQERTIVASDDIVNMSLNRKS